MNIDCVHVATPTQTAPASREPRLPQELERVIFEIATRNDRDRGIPALMQVARRVQDWLQPIIYDTVVLPSAQLYNRSKGLHRPPPRFPSGPQTLHVRNFLVSSISLRDGADEPNWEDLLPQCHNLLNLAIWTPPSPDTLSALTSILHSPLRTVTPRGLLRLSLSPERLFPGGRVDLRHEIFRHLTHLELPYGDKGTLESEWARDIPECIPQLRYLWVWIRRIPYVEVIRQILDECRFLEVFILSDNSNIYTEELDEMIKAGRRIVNADGSMEVPEDRVVVYDKPFSVFSQWTRAWYQGVVDGSSSAVAGYDIWLRSKKIIERRRWRSQLEVVSWNSLIDSDADVDA